MVARVQFQERPIHSQNAWGQAKGGVQSWVRASLSMGPNTKYCFVSHTKQCMRSSRLACDRVGT